MLFQIQYNLLRYVNKKILVELSTESEETEESSLIEPDRAVSPPVLPLSSAENKFPPLSARLIMEQLQLPVLGDDVACSIIKLSGYQPVSCGKE